MRGEDATPPAARARPGGARGAMLLAALLAVPLATGACGHVAADKARLEQQAAVYAHVHGHAPRVVRAEPVEEEDDGSWIGAALVDLVFGLLGLGDDDDC